MHNHLSTSTESRNQGRVHTTCGPSSDAFEQKFIPDSEASRSLLEQHGIGSCARCGSPDCSNINKDECVIPPTPQERWRALYRKMRLHHVPLTQSLGENEIALSLCHEPFLYPATLAGIYEAMSDIERAFAESKLASLSDRHFRGETCDCCNRHICVNEE